MTRDCDVDEPKRGACVEFGDNKFLLCLHKALIVFKGVNLAGSISDVDIRMLSLKLAYLDHYKGKIQVNGPLAWAAKLAKYTREGSLKIPVRLTQSNLAFFI